MTARSLKALIPRRLVFLGLISVSVVVVVVLASCIITPVVNVTNPARGPVVQAFYATGTVGPAREYPIKASTAGLLGRVLIDKGDRVAAGQPLVIISDPALTYAAARAAADLEEKRKRIDEKSSPVLVEFDDRLRINNERREIAERDFNRFETLVRTSAASKADRDAALDKLKLLDIEDAGTRKQRAAKLLELERELATAQAAHDTALYELEQQTLRAPVDGVVLDRPTSQGTRVAVNDVIMRVADVRPANLVMRGQVDEEDVTHCRLGQVVRMSLYAFPSQPITGRVSRIYDDADQERRTFEVEVTLDEPPDRLAAGMTGELAFIESEKHDALVLPSTALQGGRLLVVRDGRAVQADVKVGLQSVERIEVVSGVNVDDQVVVSPLGDLTNGTRVRTRYVPPSDALPRVSVDQANRGAAGIKKAF